MISPDPHFSAGEKAQVVLEEGESVLGPAGEGTVDTTNDYNEQIAAPLQQQEIPQNDNLNNQNTIHNNSSSNDNNEDHNNNMTCENDDDDDDVTIIGLDHDPEFGDTDQRAAALAWIEQNGPEMEARRRNVLLRELQRVQRASFIHFLLLCLIPTSLLFIVVATVLGEDEECQSDATLCIKETRTFVNAFTTRCICDAIDVNEGVN